MNEMDYYRVPTSEYVSYEEIKEFRDSAIKEINDTPMTKDERDAALAKLKSRKAAFINERNREPRQKQADLDKEFWNDCVKHFNYSDYLTESGIKFVHHIAYERGHANGYPTIFEELDKLDEIVVELSDKYKGR
jgi:hypothetical protein